VANLVVFGQSIDGGSSWRDYYIDFSSPIADEFAFYPPIAVDPKNPQRLLLGGSLVWSLDSAKKRFTKQSAFPVTRCGAGCALEDIEFVPRDHRRAWAVSMATPGDSRWSVVNTTQANRDRGAKWNEVTPRFEFYGTKPSQATGIAPDPSHPLVAWLSVSGFTSTTGIGHIFRTTDFGKTWSEADGVGGPSPLPDIPVLRILVDRTDPSGSTAYAGTDIGVFRTTDTGATWEPFNLGVIPAVPVFDIEQNDLGAIFVGTHGRGVYASVPPIEGPLPPATLRMPAGLHLGRTRVGRHSKSHKIILSNPANKHQKRRITIRDISVSGDFLVPPNVCLGARQPGSRCVLPVFFAPTAPGPRLGTLTITDDGSASPHEIVLKGVGRAAGKRAKDSLRSERGRYRRIRGSES
jgi:hypothetical protein